MMGVRAYAVGSESDVERGLAAGLVPAREGPARVRGLEVRGGGVRGRAVLAGVVGVAGTRTACRLKYAGELDVEVELASGVRAVVRGRGNMSTASGEV